jgi:hypothetical protein
MAQNRSKKRLRYMLNNPLKINKSAIPSDPDDQIAQKLDQLVAPSFPHKTR